MNGQQILTAVLVCILAASPVQLVWAAPREATPGNGKTEAGLERTVEVVMVDLAAGRLTFRSSVKDRPETLSASGKARKALKSLASGDKVLLTMRLDDSGTPSAIIKIRPVERIRLPDGPEARHLEPCG